MIWLDLTGSVLLMGGQINGVIHRAEVAAEVAKQMAPVSPAPGGNAGP
jgi:aminoglycoside N3'-acetyltransferase